MRCPDCSPPSRPLPLAERLEHVAVADIGHDDLDPALPHQPVEAEVRHHGDRDQLDSQVEREDGEDLVAVDRLALGVDRQHPVAVAVEGDAEVVAAVLHDALEEREIGGAAADVDVLAVGSGRDGGDLRAEPLERLGRDPRVRAVRTVDRDPQAAEIGPEPLDDVLEIAVGGDAHAVDRAGQPLREASRVAPRSPPRSGR